MVVSGQCLLIKDRCYTLTLILQHRHQMSNQQTKLKCSHIKLGCHSNAFLYDNSPKNIRTTSLPVINNSNTNSGQKFLAGYGRITAAQGNCILIILLALLRLPLYIIRPRMVREYNIKYQPLK